MGTSCDKCAERPNHYKFALGSSNSNIEASKILKEAPDSSFRITSNKRKNDGLFVAALISINSADFETL